MPSLFYSTGSSNKHSEVVPNVGDGSTPLFIGKGPNLTVSNEKRRAPHKKGTERAEPVKREKTGLPDPGDHPGLGYLVTSFEEGVRDQSRRPSLKMMIRVLLLVSCSRRRRQSLSGSIRRSFPPSLSAFLISIRVSIGSWTCSRT